MAWEILSDRNDCVDLVVTDVIMPRVSGGELYERVRQADLPTPFLFTTGYTASEIEEEALRADGVPVLNKPWTAEELVRGVRGALDAARA